MPCGESRQRPMQVETVRERERDKQTERERDDRHRQPFEIPLTNLSVSEVLNENDSPPSHTHTHKVCMHYAHTLTRNTIGKHMGMKEFASYLIKYY